MKENLMHSSTRNSEKGQAIVYLVLGLVVFFGFVALAIDGGMVLADRRHEQNAADAASLAGGAAAALHIDNNRSNTCGQTWDCPGSADITDNSFGYARAKAKSRALENDFSLDNDITDHNGVQVVCGGTDWDSAYINVTVDISATTPSNFLQLFYPNALHNEVESVTHVDPGGPIEYGNAIVALNDAICSDPGSEGVIMGGSGVASVDGGNIFSYGCLRDNGGVTVTITGNDDYGDPYGAYGADLSHITDANWDPVPQTPGEDAQTIDPMEFAIETPDCTGHYINGANFPNNPSGLYCINGDLTINNGAHIEGDNVTIYIPTGKLTVNGTPYINISACPSTSDSCPNGSIAGVLIYLPPSNTHLVKINGNEESVLTGLILAPGSTVQLNGNGKNMYNGQVIGNNVEITGNADFYLTYNGCDSYVARPKIDLYR
jgi:hypothetical protein